MDNAIDPFERNIWDLKSLTIDELRAMATSMTISRLKIDKVNKMFEQPIVYNSPGHPIVYSDKGIDDEMITISSDFFEMHKEEIIPIIVEIIKNNHVDDFSIDSKYVVPEILQALNQMEELEDLYVGYGEDYVLTKDVIDIFEGNEKISVSSEAVSDELKEDFRKVVGHNYNKRLIKFYNHGSLSTSEKIFLDDPLTDQEISNLKYLNPEAEIVVRHHDIDNMIDTFNELNKLGKNNHIVVEVYDKNDFNNYIIDRIDEVKDFNLFVKIGTRDFHVTKYVEYEKRLLDLVLPCMNLSPYEKYLYIYKTVKNFKKYKESEDRQQSRNIYDLLDNEYMVCVGYASLLIDLLGKVGIKAVDMSVTVDTGIDDLDASIEVLPEDKSIEVGHHARAMVRLKDPKYGIDGIYATDPTWDNNGNIEERDTYNYALMTTDEYFSNRSYEMMSTISIPQLLLSSDIQEFYDKINFILDRREMKNKKDKYKSLVKELSPVESDIKELIDIIKSVIKTVELLDLVIAAEFKEKYAKLYQYKAEIDMKEIQEMLYFIGVRIIPLTNKLINGETLKTGLMEAYQARGLEGEELENKVNNAMNMTRKKENYIRPVRYKITPDGEKEIYENEFNKYDLEGDKIKTL